MLSSLVYEPFLVMVSNHDAEWSRQDYRSTAKWHTRYLREAQRFRQDCHLWAEGINEKHRQFCNANQRPVPPENLAPYLYDPLFYFPLGHADLLSLVLLDDFEPVQHLTPRMRTTLESTSLAFVPQLKTLHKPVQDQTAAEDQTFIDFPGIWDLKTKAELPPLLLFCRLKLDGLASLGLALTAQSAAFRAVVRRTRKIVSALCRMCPKGESDEMRDGITLRDVSTMRCALLDLQGCEEIGLLIFCRNVSTACSIVAGARALTYQDAFDADSGLLEQLNRSRLHRKLIHHAMRESVIHSESDSVTALASNHLFKWTGSSVGVRLTWRDSDQVEDVLPGENEISGYVQAATRFQVAPGHFGQLGELRSGSLAAPSGVEYCARSRRYLVGLYDSELQHSESGLVESGRPLLKTASVIRNLDQLIQRLCCTKERQQLRSRNIVDFETDLIVPVPSLTDETGASLFCENIGQGHFAPLLLVLPQLIRRVCYSSDSDLPLAGPLDIRVLVQALRRLGTPVPLRRTIEYLYRNFAVVTADPFSFDVLLDLYDTLATLHAAITRGELLNSGAGESSDGAGRHLLDEAKVRSLASLAEALHNAMVHRTSNAFRGAEWRDMAVDFRGGLNQILFATDAPLKCGLGVLRRFASRRECLASKRSTRDRVGCLIRIGMTPGVRCHHVELGIENRARLAFFDADVPHVLHVASYADYLHEAFHLVFRAVLDDKGKLFDVIESTDVPEQQRLEEIFALALWRIFVFGTDKEAFAYHWMLSFSRDMLSVGIDDANTWRRFLEVLIQIFLATECWEGRNRDPRYWTDPRQMPLREAESRFTFFIEAVGPFFSEFSRIWNRDPGKQAYRKYARIHFRDTYARVMTDLPDLWSEALRIYRDTVAETFPARDESSLSETVTELDTLIDKGLESGTPLLWSQYRFPNEALVPPPREGGRELQNLDRPGLDPLQFVCRILYRYIRRINEGSGKQIHLLRDSIHADVHYEGRSDWWGFQSDKGAAALFCCIPELRKERLRKQIAVMKSFWDLASELRARRFLEMLALAGFPEDTPPGCQ